MGRGRFTEEEMDILRKNPYVSDVEEFRVIYTNEFKFHFMEEYNAGKKPTQIFRDAGFEPKILGSKRIERAAHRWRESYASGSLGQYQDGTVRKRRGHEIQKTEKEICIDDYIRRLEQQQTEIDELKEEIKSLRMLIVNGKTSWDLEEACEER